MTKHSPNARIIRSRVREAPVLPSSPKVELQKASVKRRQWQVPGVTPLPQHDALDVCPGCLSLCSRVLATCNITSGGEGSPFLWPLTTNAVPNRHPCWPCQAHLVLSEVVSFHSAGWVCQGRMMPPGPPSGLDQGTWAIVLDQEAVEKHCFCVRPSGPGP